MTKKGRKLYTSKSVDDYCEEFENISEKRRSVKNTDDVELIPDDVPSNIYKDRKALAEFMDKKTVQMTEAAKRPANNSNQSEKSSTKDKVGHVVF